MKNTKRIGAFCLSIALALSLAACAGKQDTGTVQSTPTAGTEELQDMLSKGTYKPADVGLGAEELYKFPFMGMNMKLPQELLDAIEKKDLYMTQVEGERTDAGELSYGVVTWSGMTEEQRTEELSIQDGDMGAWLKSLRLIGAIGAYQKDMVDQLDALSGCTHHEKLGESSDGKYVYYRSYTDEASADEVASLQAITMDYTDIEPYPDYCGADGLNAGDAASDSEAGEFTGGTQVGDFSTQDIQGNSVDQSIFSQHKLTLVNIMATWCSPCVQEFPAFEEMRQELEKEGLGLAAFVMDTREDGAINQDALDSAKTLAERTGVQFPLLVPDETMLGGKLDSIMAFPTSFFVDENGTIVGDAFAGAHTAEEWVALAREQLEKLGD